MSDSTYLFYIETQGNPKSTNEEDIVKSIIVS